MSAPETKVDVLAVMERAEDEQLHRFEVAFADEIRQARAAVAEMIEAAKGLERKLWEVASRHNDRSCDYDVCSETRRFRAALAGMRSAA